MFLDASAALAVLLAEPDGPAFLKTMEPARVLAEIKRLDAVQWSQPSNSLAIQIEKLEKQYEAATGQPCPAWPGSRSCIRLPAI